MTTDHPMQPILAENELNPKSANEWLALMATTIGVLVWFWRHALNAACRWLINLAMVPNNVSEIRVTLKRHQFGIATGIARSRATLNGFSIPAWETGKEGECLFVNDAMLLLTEYNPGDILGRAWVNIIHEDDRAKVIQEWDCAIAENRDFLLHYRWVTRTQTVLHIRAKATRLLDAETGETLGWIAFVTVNDVEGFKKEITQ